MAPVRRWVRIDTPVHAAFDGVFQNHSTSSDDAVWRDVDAVSNRRIDANEAIGAYRHTSRDDCMTGDEAIVPDRDVVSDMITAPQDDVVTDLDEWLNDIRFEH